MTYISRQTFKDCHSLVSVTIPKYVNFISPSAFEGCSGLTSINIPDAVTSIGNSAFQNCDNLRSINIGKSVTSISDKAFLGAESITEIYSFSVVPPKCDTSTFSKNVYETACLYVPNSNDALMLYKIANGWRNFYNIQEKDLTGVEVPNISPLPAERNYYNLQGQRVTAPASGINIMNGKKILINR